MIKPLKKKPDNPVREWINTFFWAGLIAIIFRSLLLEPFNIPSGSMIPTLHVGDHLFVTKWSYGYSRNSFPFGSWNLWEGRAFGTDPEMGDVIVFRKPGGKIDYVKRLVGLPGDTVQIISGRLYINGVVAVRENPQPYVIANVPKSLRRAGYQRVNPDGKIMVIRGDRIFVDNRPAEFNFTIQYRSSAFCRRVPWECGIIDATEYEQVLPNGVRHRIIEISDNEHFDNTQLFTVPAGHYFMLGDNRDMSRDSRAEDVGFVPRDNLIGRVWFVWYSHNYYAPLLFVWSWFDKMRWNRFGLVIR
ncbi:MAG: signal peptidase I [Alphaproteobacteria bacterium]|nr:signal peptidase I [Alphaproteobacteria bacterium]